MMGDCEVKDITSDYNNKDYKKIASELEEYLKENSIGLFPDKICIFLNLFEEFGKEDVVIESTKDWLKNQNSPQFFFRVCVNPKYKVDYMKQYHIKDEYETSYKQQHKFPEFTEDYVKTMMNFENFKIFKVLKITFHCKGGFFEHSI